MVVVCLEVGVEMVRVKSVGGGLKDWIGRSEIGFGCLRRRDESGQLLLTSKSIEFKECNPIRGNAGKGRKENTS